MALHPKGALHMHVLILKIILKFTFIIIYLNENNAIREK